MKAKPSDQHGRPESKVKDLRVKDEAAQTVRGGAACATGKHIPNVTLSA